jgi:hypothetical protein
MTNLIGNEPPKFYKYRSVSGEAAKWVEKIVLHHEVFFAPATSFNDPFDLRPAFSLQASPSRQREDYLRLSRKFEPHLTEVQRESDAENVMATAMNVNNLIDTTIAIQALHNHYITASVGVFCVSTKRDDILMWAHYAESHKGICLEFDGKLSFMTHAQKVLYSEDRTPINVYDDANDVAMTKALLTKSTHWSYEQEWRLMRYQEGPGVVQFHPSNLTGIVIGALATSSTVEMVESWVQQRTLPLNIYRASVSGTKFELEINQHKNRRRR